MESVSILVCIVFWLVAIPVLVVSVARFRRHAVKILLGSAVILALPCLVTLLMGRWLFLDEPLQSAAEKGDVVAIRSLLRSGANPNSTGEMGTPIALAVQSGSTESVRALLAAGADINATDSNGRTPLTIAKQAGNEQIAQYLRHAGGHE